MTGPPPPPAPPQPPSSPTPTKRAFWGYGVEATILLFVVAFAAAVVLPTWLLGGFEQQPQPLPKIQVGETVKYGEFKIKPIGAKLVDEHPTSEFDNKKGHAYLVMQVTVENRTKKTAYTFDELVLLEQPVFTKPTPPDKTGLVRDGSGTATLHPHVPETLQLIWPIPDTQAAKIGDTLELTLQRQQWAKSLLENRYKWMSPEPWLTVVTPVVREGT